MAGLLSGVFGSKPTIPNPVDTASTAITGNLSNLPNILNLTKQVDTASNEDAAMAYQQNLPNYEGMLQSATGNVTDELSGKLPQDVVNQISQAAAERGVSSGQGAGSPNSTAAYLSALGLNSLQMEQSGQQGFSQLMKETPVGQQFNPASMFVTPGEEQGAMTAQAYINAAPDPVLSGINDEVMTLLGEFMSKGGGGSPYKSDEEPSPSDGGDDGSTGASQFANFDEQFDEEYGGNGF